MFHRCILSVGHGCVLLNQVPKHSRSEWLTCYNKLLNLCSRLYTTRTVVYAGTQLCDKLIELQGELRVDRPFTTGIK